LRQLLAAGFIDQVAARKDVVQTGTGTQHSTARDVPYRVLGVDGDVYIHPSSVLAGGPPPEYVVYHEVVRAGRVWIRGACLRAGVRRAMCELTSGAGVTAINPAWLAVLGKGSLCTFSKPVRNGAAR